MPGVVGIYSSRLETVTVTVAAAAADGGYVVRAVTDRPPADKHQEYFTGQLRLIPGVEILYGRHDLAFDHLFVEFYPGGGPHAGWYTARAGRVVLLSEFPRQPYLRSCREQIKYLVRGYPWAFRARSHGSLEDYHPFDLFRLTGKRFLVGVPVHRNFLINPPWREIMFRFEWDPESRRRFRLNFVGNEQPDGRRAALREVEAVLAEHRIEKGRAGGGDVFWAASDPIDPPEYAEVLGQSDLTLCPPGYSGWTHRVVEALTRGSVPILEEGSLDCYGLGLRAGYNCVAVRRGGWAGAVRDALALPPDALAGMRRNILRMKDGYLSFDASMARLRRRLGI